MSTDRKPGRPKKGMIVEECHIGGNIPIQTATALRQRQQETGVSISFMLARAIEKYLEEVKPAK